MYQKKTLIAPRCLMICKPQAQQEFSTARHNVERERVFVGTVIPCVPFYFSNAASFFSSCFTFLAISVIFCRCACILSHS